MRLASLSDIHGNLTALEAVVADISRRGVDHVAHGGDLALVGCQPAEVIDRVRELGWPGIVGNTDELLWRARRAAKPHRLHGAGSAAGSAAPYQLGAQDHKRILHRPSRLSRNRASPRETRFLTTCSEQRRSAAIAR